MKKFALILVALCALTCLFVSCDTAADDDDSSLIGTWLNDEKTWGFEFTNDQGRCLTDDGWSSFAPYTYTDEVFTIMFDTGTFSYSYTISGNTMTVPHNLWFATLTKQ